MTIESRFQKEDINTAQNGAEVYYIGAAKEAVENHNASLPLKEIINSYCTDPHFAQSQVTEYLQSLPTNDELVMRAFILYEILTYTRNTLAQMVGEEQAMLEQAARGQKDKAVDDSAISNSAGYSSDIDDEVAKSSKTDKAQQNDVSDQDIGESASEDVTYIDQTAISSPTITFMQQTMRLAQGICNHCLQDGDVQLLVDAELAKEGPDVLVDQIQDLTVRLEPPRDEDK